MSRKSRRGYFVDGQFVTQGSALDVRLKQELAGDTPSKSALKRQSRDLQKLGEQLLGLKSEARQKLALPLRLKDALDELERIKSHEGRRRQSQYVGKLMRQLEVSELEAIHQALEADQLGSATQTARLHQLEQWRERLLDKDPALTLWMEQYPQTDVQKLRTLIRQARKDKTPPISDAQPGQALRHSRAYRQLFQLLQEQIQKTENTHAKS